MIKEFFLIIFVFIFFGSVLVGTGCQSRTDVQKKIYSRDINSTIKRDSVLLISPEQVDSVISLSKQYPYVSRLDIEVNDCDLILSQKIDSAIKNWTLLEYISYTAYDSSYIPESFFSLNNLEYLSINFEPNVKYGKQYCSTSDYYEIDLFCMNKRYIKNANVLNRLSQLLHLKKLSLNLGLYEIPIQVFDLNLEELRLDFNCISNIDTSMYRMKFLKKLTLVNNPIVLSKKQLKEIKEKMPRTKIYFEPPLFDNK